MANQQAQPHPGPRELLSGAPGRVHMVGIGGVGMAGLAALLRARGFVVSGCDARRNDLTRWLAGLDIAVAQGHDPAHVAAAVDWVIRTAAVRPEHPEIEAARGAGLPVFARGRVLPELLGGAVSIAVGGTHGKTTTAGFVAQLLLSAGADPSWCIGGTVPALGAVARAGGGPHMVVEADESDGTLALYRPEIAVITNVEFDHMEHFASEQDFRECFEKLVRQTRRCVVYCADDARAAELGGAARRGLAYGFGAGADIRGSDLELGPDSVAFAVSVRNVPAGRVRLPAPGEHNARNALAALAAGLALDLDAGAMLESLANVRLPARRFERIVAGRPLHVVSDYAHHPTEIAALVRTARGLKPREMHAVFQPHRYTRTRALGPDFAPAFAGVDSLILLPVYAAAERPLAGGRTADLYARFRDAAARGAAPPRQVALADSLEQAWGHLRGTLRPGDLLLVAGAGDVERLAGWAGAAFGTGGSMPAAATPRPPQDLLSDASRLACDAPLGERTTLGVGGKADVWVEAGSEQDLARLLAWTHEAGVPCRVLGAGSNLLVSDLGVRGVVCRLTGAVFRHIGASEKGPRAGAGVPLGRLLDWCQEAGRGGMEFLEGVPGTVGGALRMNAGAWDAAIGGRISWIRCLNRDGTACMLAPDEVGWGYRDAPGLEGRVVVAAAFDTTPSPPDRIARRRAALRERRAWMPAARTAGSIFKNPAGGYAGALIERAGLKGLSVGGATVSEAHGNVIRTRRGATASDVRALIEIVRERVATQQGVSLEPEIRFLS